MLIRYNIIYMIVTVKMVAACYSPKGTPYEIAARITKIVRQYRATRFDALPRIGAAFSAWPDEEALGDRLAV